MYVFERGSRKTEELRKMKTRIRKTLYKKTIEDRVVNNVI